MGRKHIYILATGVLAAASLLTGLYAMSAVIGRDRTAPEIELQQPVLELSVNYTQEDLLRGVSAMDRRDGDVTDSLVVEQIGKITDEHTAPVTYAAFDHSGNVAKAVATLAFTDYQPPRFGMERALVIPEGVNQDVLHFLTAQDVVDGDISSRIKGNLVSDTISLSYPGVHQVEFRVTNSMGDTAKITLPVDVCSAGTFNADVRLEEYLVYVPVGAVFSGADYLHSMLAGSMEYALDGSDPSVQVRINETGPRERQHLALVDMNSDVNTAVPGIYSVTYEVTLDDRYMGFSRLNVVVEE